MARKKIEEMDVTELIDLVRWYDGRLRYVRFLLKDKFDKEI